MSDISCIVLAAGLGTRMKTDIPKVLHGAGGRTLLGHVLSSLQALSPSRVVTVIGPDMPAVADEARRYVKDSAVAVQGERLGTGHAVLAARDHAAGLAGTVLILYGDVPLIRPETLRTLCGAIAGTTKLAVLGFEAANPTGYGRLVRNGDGGLLAIREELDASPEERKIKLCNSGIMAAQSELLWRLLPRIGRANAKGEYYLTDIVGLAVAEGAGVAVTVCPESEVQGVNSRAQLAAIEAALQQCYRQKAMAEGATLIAPDTVFLSADTRIGRDVVIEPNVIIGPRVVVGDRVTIRGFCHLEGAAIEDGAIIGPFARLRPGAAIGLDAHIGNFVEVKNASIEAGAKANHLAYIGDARVGAKANVGAGAITCNYDGFSKNHTDIGAGAFIGSNSSLVAPVKIGDGAYVGSGSVITRNVPADSLALGRGQQETKEGWASRFRAAAKARKKGSGK